MPGTTEQSRFTVVTNAGNKVMPEQLRYVGTPRILFHWLSSNFIHPLYRRQEVVKIMYVVSVNFFSFNSITRSFVSNAEFQVLLPGPDDWYFRRREIQTSKKYLPCDWEWVISIANGHSSSSKIYSWLLSVLLLLLLFTSWLLFSFEYSLKPGT